MYSGDPARVIRAGWAKVCRDRSADADFWPVAMSALREAIEET